jgi:pimeloyl-ACP methyl ester carboxylesterase
MRIPRQYHISTNGVDTAVTEWAGDGDPVLLLHATGFHSRCWDQVVHRLPDRHIYAVDLRFHGSSNAVGPVNWTTMCEDISTLIMELDLKNIMGVGHSIGGHIAARVCAWQPARFRRLILIDPVIFSPAHYAAFESRLEDIDPTSHPVSKRKNKWHDADEMFERFKSREPFSTWDPTVLRDYCDHALRPAADSDYMKLACDPINEASIYLSQSGNDDIYRELPTIKTPAILLRANPGDRELPDLSTSPTWPELALVLENCEDVYLPDMNHFIPMQNPGLVAGYINDSKSTSFID